MSEVTPNEKETKIQELNAEANEVIQKVSRGEITGKEANARTAEILKEITRIKRSEQALG